MEHQKRTSVLGLEGIADVRGDDRFREGEQGGADEDPERYADGGEHRCRDCVDGVSGRTGKNERTRKERTVRGDRAEAYNEDHEEATVAHDVCQKTVGEILGLYLLASHSACIFECAA